MAESWTDQIERTLTELIEWHDRWLEAVADHRAAMSQADAPRLERATLQQQEIMAAIAQLEHQRQEIVRSLVNASPALRELDQQGSPLPTITQLAAIAPEPMRSRLLDLGDQLRTRVQQLRKEQSALRLAARALAAHMEGLAQRVARVLSNAVTYSARGEVASTGTVAIGIDLTS